MNKYKYVVVERELEDYSPDTVSDLSSYNTPEEAFKHKPEDVYSDDGYPVRTHYVEMRERN